MSRTMSNDNDSDQREHVTEYVTVMIGGQLFGLPIARVQDVFMPDRLTRVPLAPPEIAGVLNLRGRIVTAIDMRRRLGLPPRATGAPPMAVGHRAAGESYGLLIDYGRRGAEACRRHARGQPGQSRCRARRACRPACIGSTVSSWSSSTSTACSTCVAEADGRLKLSAT